MDTKALTISKLFKRSSQYVIPIFQRHYVWDKESQWESLWDDIASQTRARLENRSKPHYCGAIVLDQKKLTSVDELPRFEVIDGQQRLTTFQIVIAAMRDVIVAGKYNDLLDDVVKLLVNPNAGDLPNPASDQYKLRPTKFDKSQFIDVISLGDKEKLRQKYNSKSGANDNRIVNAYMYFYDKISSALRDRQEMFGSEAYSEEDILKGMIESFSHFFQAVQIVLDNTDDAQIIFESLNSRGTPLLASDLMRNRIFMRAESDKDPVEQFYDKYWSSFEETFWTTEEKQGRLKKARLEFLMINVLSARTSLEIHHSRIYQEYITWLNNEKHDISVEKELIDLSEMASVYRNLVEGKPTGSVGRFGKFLNIFDVSTVYPYVMALVSSGASENECSETFLVLESFIVRRQICGRKTNNYNKLFLSALKSAKISDFKSSDLVSFLKSQIRESTDWPSDAEIRTKWLTRAAYGNNPPGRVEYILKKIESYQRSKFSEDVSINSKLSIEHVMPQAWYDAWPLKAGVYISKEQAQSARQRQVLGLHLDEAEKLAARRESLVHTFGNLTLLTTPLNSSVGNGPYLNKRTSIIEQSALRLNRYFNNALEWDEDSIALRGEAMLEDALKIWPKT